MSHQTPPHVRVGRVPTTRLTGRIDRWLSVLSLSLHDLGWPTAADCWLDAWSRQPATPPAAELPTLPQRDGRAKGDTP